jgi:hypothetical protein
LGWRWLVILIKKTGCVEISSSIVGNALSAPGHGSPLEEFAYLDKQKGPHGAAPSPEASMLIGEQLQAIMAIVLRR